MIKFKKILVVIGEICKGYMVLWFIFMLFLTFSGAAVTMFGTPNEYQTSLYVITISLLVMFGAAIFSLIGYLVYFSGFICYDGTNHIYRHQWDEYWRDK